MGLRFGIAQAQGLGKALKKIDPSRKGKEHLRNSLMYNILSASLQEKVDEILSNLEKTSESSIDTSLNVNYSLVPEEIWNSTPFDTNYAESDTQIGWKYDENMYKRFEVHNNIGVTMSSKDKSILKLIVIKISNTKRSTKSSISQNLKKKQKSSQPQTGDNDKIIFINDDQLSTSEKSLQLKQSEIELEGHHISLEERKLKIKEYELDLKMKELKYKKKLNKLELAPGNDKLNIYVDVKFDMITVQIL
nr:14097_t:CDS:2 [Entrophospora candida]